MKHLFSFTIMILLACNLLGQTTWFGPNYVHLNSSSNCYDDYTLLDTLTIGNNLSDIILFTHVWGVNGGHTEYMTRSCGLWHTGAEWSIFDETQQLMDTNYAFNVLNADVNGTGFTHTVTSGNLYQYYSKIDNPLLNGHPEKIFFIAKTWTNYVYDTAHVGVWYDVADGKWTIYNEAGFPSTLELNSVYNIFIPGDGTSYFKHIADGTSYITVIDDPRLNGNETARIFAVHDYTTNGGTPGYINDELGVWYNGANWTIYSESYTPLFVGAAFNVMIISDVMIGLPDVKEESCKLKVFPNPAKNELSVLLNKQLMTEIVNFRLTSIDGRTVFEKSVVGDQNRQITFDIHNIAAGLYLLYATTIDGIVSAKVNIVN